MEFRLYCCACRQELPIYEPGLFEVVKEARGRNLFFSTDTQKHVAEGDIIFVRYPSRTMQGLSPVVNCSESWWLIRGLRQLAAHRSREVFS